MQRRGSVSGSKKSPARTEEAETFPNQKLVFVTTGKQSLTLLAEVREEKATYSVYYVNAIWQ